jgi:hypothetical protein
MVHLLLDGHLPNKNGIVRIMEIYDTDDVCTRIIYFLVNGKIDDKWEAKWEDAE